MSPKIERLGARRNDAALASGVRIESLRVAAVAALAMFSRARHPQYLWVNAAAGCSDIVASKTRQLQPRAVFQSMTVLKTLLLAAALALAAPTRTTAAAALGACALTVPHCTLVRQVPTPPPERVEQVAVRRR